MVILGVLVQSAIQYLLEPYVGTNGKIFTETLGTPLALIEIVTLCLISPVLEEMLFQGAIQKGLLKKINPYVSTLLTAIIFCFSHGYGISLSTLSLFAPCLAFGIIYQFTDDIKMPILCHSMSNFIALIYN